MLARFDPLREMSNLRRDIERLFDESFFREVGTWPEPRTATRLRDWPMLEADVASLPIDLYEEGNNLMVKASVPGLKPEEIKIEVKGDVLHIFGENKKEEEKKERNLSTGVAGRQEPLHLSTGVAGRQEPLHYHLKEHRYSRFERSILLPSEVNAEKAQAVFDNGMLILTLPKTETSKTRQIPVKTTRA